MAGEKFIALEETSQEIKTTVNDVKTNVDGLKNTDVPGIDTLVNAVLERIGQAGDTGNTVMGKLNRPQGGGKGYVAVSDMSVKNEEAKKELCTFNYTTADYSYTGFIVNDDIYILGYLCKSDVVDINVYKITDFKSSAVSTLILSNSDFPCNSNVTSCGVCSNLKNKFYLLTNKATLIKIDVENKIVSALKTNISMSSYPLALAVNEDETYCSYVSYSGSGNATFYIYDLVDGKSVMSKSVSRDMYRTTIWFEGSTVNTISGSDAYVHKYSLGGTLISSKGIDIPSGYYSNIQKEYIFFYYGSSGTAKIAIVYNIMTGEQYNLGGVMTSSSSKIAFLGEISGKVIYLDYKTICLANAYAPGEICLYLKAGDKVYTDGLIRDIDFVNVPNVDEVVTIPKDSKYLLHGYSYITVG